MPAERQGYTVSMFAIDISKPMGSIRSVALPPGPNGEERWSELTNLEWALRYVKFKVQDMIHNGRKTDQCGVIVFGSEETDNIVNRRAGDGYENVSEYIKIGQPNIGTLAKLDALQPSETFGDPLDALIVAAETQQQHLASKKTWTRKIFLVTDAESPVEEEDWETIVAKLQDYNVQLTIVGIDFDDVENGFEYPGKSRHKKQNEPFLHQFAEAMGDNGVVGTMEYAIAEVMRPEPKSTRSVLMGQVLRIGDPDLDKEQAIEIMVKTSKATALTRPTTMKKYALRGEDDEKERSQQAMAVDGDEKKASFAQLKMRTEYYIDTTASEEKDAEEVKLEDDDDDEDLLLGGSVGPPIIKSEEEKKKEAETQIRVEKEELIKGFKYGTTYVPCPDGQFSKLETTKGIEIIYFFSAKKFRRELAMGEVTYIWGDPTAPIQQIALSSLVQAMSSCKKFAVARYVGRDGSDPKMVVLAPSNVGDIDCLLMVRMPFADDVRKYTFASLDVLVNKKGERVTEHPYIPTGEQIEAMDAFVDAMDLSMAGEKDEDGRDRNRTSWFSTQESFNPAIHRIKQAIFHSAVVPDISTNPIGPPHNELLKYLTPPAKVLKKAKEPLETCKKVFNVKQVPKRGGKKAKDGHAHAPDEDEAPLLLDRKPARDQTQFLGEPESPVAGSSKASEKKKEQPAEDNSDTEDDDDDLLLGAASSSKKPQAPPTPSRSTSPPPTKRAKVVPSEDEDGDVDMDDAPAVIDAGRAPGRIIGNTDPLKDFKKNLRQGDVVTKAVEDMGVVIIEVVMKPFAKRRHEEMMACMKEMRKVSLEEDEVEAWNAFLGQLKKKCLASPGNAAFWNLVREEGRKLSLITDKEAEALGGISQYSERQAEEFVA